MNFFNYRQWPVKYRILSVFFVFILFFILFANRAHADELNTAGQLTKDAIIDGLAATVSIIAATEQAVTGNFYTGASLAIIGAHEAYKAYEEAKEAWHLYWNRDNDSDRDVSPVESSLDHGRD